ncbi:complex I subunit 5 family protein [Rhodococcus sp. 14-2470-1a]|uniref:complex I subunit 5 family protein n=1 Tax=Rhodococcus sp. 14-2470-1a TaxID=2023150 RepID=UPI000B9C358B|nr:proton-conducting transporter membrane subunit [Rhodococcus sp. 14-2470-1a]OZF42001.1 sodium:proton antiporter [Rhodococcus sp. 14-2470-1a]
MSTWLPLLIFAPLIGASLAVMLPRWGAAVTAVCSVAVLGLSIAVTRTVLGGAPVSTELSGWAQPVGIGLRVDGLSAAMLLLTAVVGSAIAIYASATEKARGNRFFWPLWMLLWAGLDAVYIAADLFNTYVALELVTVAAVGLVAIGGRNSLAPSLRYLFVGILGSLGFLIAVALIYSEAGTLSIADVSAALTPGIGVTTALVVATVGLGLKTALWPLHAWLPPAHAGSPSAVSPLMSALVIKASFYVLVRLWISLPASDIVVALAQVVGVLGAVALLWGSVAALRQSSLKRVVAYSTVAQVGYFFLLFPIVAPGLLPDAEPAAIEAAALGFQGVLVFLIAHGLAKAAMFSAAGALTFAHGTDDLSSMQGASVRNPRAVFAFAVAGVSLAGLPPTLAFTGKWQILSSTLESGQWWWLAFVLVGGVATFSYTVRVVAITMAPVRDEVAWTRPPRRMEWVPLVLAASVVVLGVQGSLVLSLTDLSGVLQ